jgi:hypothetical protein
LKKRKFAESLVPEAFRKRYKLDIGIDFSAQRTKYANRAKFCARKRFEWVLESERGTFVPITKPSHLEAKPMRKQLVQPALLAIMLGAAGLASAGELVGIKAAQRILKGEAKMILLLAHPTCKLTAAELEQAKTFRDGSFQLTATLDYLDADREEGYRTLRFHFDAKGKLASISDGPGTGFVPPFFASGLILEVIKGQVRRDPKMSQDPLGLQLLEVRDARQALVLLLQFKQKQ